MRPDHGHDLRQRHLQVSGCVVFFGWGNLGTSRHTSAWMRPDHGHDLRQRHVTSSFDANVHARLYGSDVGADAAYDRTLDVNAVRRRQRRHFSF